MLGRIGPVRASNVGRLRFNVYGTSGTGKTRFACTFPKPLLLIGTEDGTASVVGTPGVDFVHLNTTDELTDVIEMLRGGHYKTAVLDTITQLRGMRIAEITGTTGKTVRKTWGNVTRDQWGQCAFNMVEMIGPLLSLTTSQDINVVLTAQEANTTRDEGGGGSDILRPNMASAVGKSVSDWVSAQCDYLGQMLIRDRFETQTTSTGALELSEQVRVGSEYAMRIGPDGTYRTKFRRSLTVTTPLPDFVVDPSYAKIVKLIRGEVV